MMLQTTLVFCTALLLTTLDTAAQSRLYDSLSRSEMQNITFERIWGHASVLAHDSLLGRGTGDIGERKAADYIAQRLKEAGLLPIGISGSFLQRIPMHGSIPQPDSRLRLESGDSITEFSIGHDYVLFKTGAQTYIPHALPLVFVGYGIIAPEFDYNDYQNLDVNGAIVVFLAGEPISEDVTYFNGDHSTLYSIPELKQRIAMSRGAFGSIMLPFPGESAPSAWTDWVQMFAFEDVTLPVTIPSHLSILMNPDRADMLFRNAEWSFQDVMQHDASSSIRSFKLKTKISFTGVFRERDFLAYNVAGILRGSDPLLQDSWVLCTAHYDHLGVDPAMMGDSIYNGLVDNALGVAAVLEFARVLAQSESRPRHSILFLFLTGEEKGLLGSQYYCDHPIVPLHRTIACLNVDGIGIIDEFDDIVGIGSDLSTLQDLLDAVATELELRVAAVPHPFEHLDAFASSDQIAFAQAGIPSMLIMEGSTYRNLGREPGLQRFVDWGRERYHTPFDDLSQPINPAAVVQHSRVLLAVLSALADIWVAPQWLSGAQYINARLRSLADEL